MATLPELSVRPITSSDIKFIADYWLGSDHGFLEAMGVDTNKLPSREELTQMLSRQIETPLSEKRSYCIIWLADGKPMGHCNTNPTSFGIDAYIHLHIWHEADRKSGMGLRFLEMTLHYFFNDLKLQAIYSEPYALNPAPHRTLEKAGFNMVKEHTTTPGSLNFEQPVKRWELTRERFQRGTSQA